MGMDQTVVFPGRPIPAWSEVAGLLARGGCPVQMRMIDGELAFPDEAPPENWREIRVGAAGGMVTIRRAPDQVVLVTWGNADPALRQLWNALAWAWAESGAGWVQTPDGPLDPAAFSSKAELPEALKVK
jgi:hypothetical protein